MQGVQSSVEFVLNGELASSSSQKVHKCELKIRVKTLPELHGDEQQTRLCNKYFETYYGAFTDLCTNDGKQFTIIIIQYCYCHPFLPPAALPHVDLVYYVLPESELASLTFMESLNTSIGSSRLRLVRVITVSLEIPRGEEILVGTPCTNLTRFSDGGNINQPESSHIYMITCRMMQYSSLFCSQLLLYHRWGWE